MGKHTVRMIRLHIARVMIHAALRVWPDDAARALLIRYLNAYGLHVMRAIKQTEARDG